MHEQGTEPHTLCKQCIWEGCAMSGFRRALGATEGYSRVQQKFAVEG